MAVCKHCPDVEYTRKSHDGGYHSIECRFWHKVNLGGPIPSHRPWLGGCFEWTAGCFRKGYGKFGVDGKMVQTHRWVWEYANGPIPPGKQINHKCDNPKCVRLDHLKEGDHQSNMDDKVQKGRQWHPKGELCGMSKLTDADVIEIRRRYAEGGVTQEQLGRLYGVHRMSICDIVNRVKWKHIPEQILCGTLGEKSV